MDAPTVQNPSADLAGPAVRLGVLHAVVWAGLMAFLLWRAPAYKRAFIEAEIELPAVTSLGIASSDWMRANAVWFAAPFVALTGGGVGALFYVLGRFVARPAAWAWFLVAFLVQAACIVMLYLGFILPMRALARLGTGG